MSPEDIARLCRTVEETFGSRVATPKQFEALRLSILDRTGVLFSATTLKRLWGYLNENVAPRRSTLDTLAAYAGWIDMNRLLSGIRPDIESGIVAAARIDVAKDLVKGDRIRFMWPPDRVCEVTYMGNARFEVTRSEGTRLQPGDTFVCHLAVAGEPLYLDSLTHNGMKGATYVCGRRSGITFAFPDDTALL